MAEVVAVAREPFPDLATQREAATLGLWVFLATEAMLFGALLLGYAVYRASYPEAFAEASHRLYRGLATANTALLLTSSLTMALAVHAARLGRRGGLLAALSATGLLGAAFLGLKGIEWGLDLHDGTVPGAHFDALGLRDPAHAELFLVLYWVLTPLHATHLLIGIGVVGALLVLALKGDLTPAQLGPLENGGLYWHLVDVVWVWLFPLLYLVS